VNQGGKSGVYQFARVHACQLRRWQRRPAGTPEQQEPNRKERRRRIAAAGVTVNSLFHPLLHPVCFHLLIHPVIFCENGGGSLFHLLLHPVST
jgi:hypothetical protein